MHTPWGICQDEWAGRICVKMELEMCRAATCRKCGKTTWAGCGNHVDQVMRNVPKNDRCTCSTDAAAPGAQAGGAGWLGKLFGRK